MIRSSARFEPLEERTLLSATDLGIVALGDSITYGFLHPDHSYRYYLSEALDDAGVEYDFMGALASGHGFDNQHHAIPGVRAADSYTRWTGEHRPSIAESLRHGDVVEPGETPNVVLLHIGTNSIGEDPASVGSAIGELRTALGELGRQQRTGTFAPDLKVFLAKVVPGARGHDQGFSSQRLLNTHAYNDQIDVMLTGMRDRQFVDRVTTVDFFTTRIQDLADAGLSASELGLVNTDADAYVDWFEDLDEGHPSHGSTGVNPAIMTDHDYLHPTALGYQVMGLTWFAALQHAGMFDALPSPAATPLPTSAAAPLVTPPTGPGVGYDLIASADFDGDGDDDTLYRDADTASTLLWEYEDGELVAEHTLRRMVRYWTLSDTKDYNHDGKADLLWVGRDGRTGFWLMDGPKADVHWTSQASPDWQYVDSHDANRNGSLDLFWDTGSHTVAWIMNGTAVTSSITNPGYGYDLVALADFDGDGDDDAVFRKASAGSTLLWEYEDGEIVSRHTLRPVDDFWTIVDARDYDQDGTTDFLWVGRDGRTGFWFMDGPAEDLRWTQRAASHWNFLESRDINDDGGLDLLWDTSRNTTAWVMDGTQVTRSFIV